MELELDKSLGHTRLEDFRGAKGSWLSRLTTIATIVPVDTWLVLSGSFFQGVDQVADIRISTARGTLVETATAVNVAGVARSWVIAIRSEARIEEHLYFNFPYEVPDVPGQLFCNRMRLLSADMALTRLHWLGDAP